MYIKFKQVFVNTDQVKAMAVEGRYIVFSELMFEFDNEEQAQMGFEIICRNLQHKSHFIDLELLMKTYEQVILK